MSKVQEQKYKYANKDYKRYFLTLDKKLIDNNLLNKGDTLTFDKIEGDKITFIRR